MEMMQQTHNPIPRIYKAHMKHYDQMGSFLIYFKIVALFEYEA